MAVFAIIIRQYLSFYKKHKSCTMFLFTGTLLLAFLAIGASIIQVTESEEYENAQKAVLDAKEHIIKRYPNMPADALNDFMEELTIIGIRGLPRRNSTIAEWKFSESWFFVVTLVTTVGYGNFTPRTLNGKIFCIVYTSIGIPLAMVHFALLVEFLMKWSESYKSVLFRLYQGKIPSFFIRLIHAGTITAGTVLIIVILPAAFFTVTEKAWGMFDGIYYCFISLTTVGLGDLVPTMDHDMSYANLYIFATSFYLLGGIAVTMFVMSVLTDFFRNYKNDYQQLPYTIPSEKFHINPSTVHTYGSILTQSGKSEGEEKSIVRYDQLLG